MGDSRTIKRIHCKLDEFPAEVRAKVDEMLTDPQCTYQGIAETLTEDGYEISKSAIHRYATNVGAVQRRMRAIGDQTRQLVCALKDNQDVEATEVANALLLDALTRRIATAEEEFDSLPLDKAGRLLVALQRSTVYKARTMEDKTRLVGRVQEAYRNQLRDLVQGDEALMARLTELLERASQEVLASES